MIFAVFDVQDLKCRL